MSFKCLLCGYKGEEKSASEVLPCCSWCQEEAKALHATEVSALIKLEKIKPYFSIWSHGRREDSLESAKRNCEHEPQPAKVFPGLQLYIGDMDDAADVQHLSELGIGCVVNLCADQLKSGYEKVPLALARAGIHQHILSAHDSRNFDILAVAEHAYDAIDAALKSTAKNNGVLIHCWGGVNRSAAVLVAYLTLRRGVPLFAAVDQCMKKRGTVLTNQSFRKQLVHLCFKNDLEIEKDEVPPALMVASVETTAAIQLDMSCNDPETRHRQGEPRDTPVYGLLYAAKDGCLACVKRYIEDEGVDYKCRSATRGYNAEDWAQWELKQSMDTQKHQKRKRCEAVLEYLASCAEKDSNL